MTIPNRHRSRGKEVLGLLRQHGPLSIDILQRMTDPPMKKKRLRESLGILQRKGFVMRRSVSQIKTFYQLSQDLKDRESAALVLGCAPDDLFQPLLSRRDWIHNECCEYWIHIITKSLPDATVIRASEFNDSEEAQRIMMLGQKDYELLPDFLLLLKGDSTSEKAAIAMEIERTRKSNSRLVAKLKKYAGKTFVDGLVYVCDSNRLSETIRLLYQEQIAQSAPRIRHYSNNFFLISDAIESTQNPLFRLFTAQRECVCFVSWSQYLQSTKRTLRRNIKLA